MRHLDPGPPSDEIRFHLREIEADLTIMAADLAAAAEMNSYRRLEKAINGVLAGLEHDVQEHGQKLRALLHSPAIQPRELCWAEESQQSSADTSPAQASQALQREYRVLVTTIATAHRYIQEAARALDQQDRGLAALTEKAITQLEMARPTAEGAAKHTRLLADLQNPTAAAWRAEQEVRSTPVREAEHAAARTLTMCPECGSSLGPDDRTFTGSFCENCGTRWNLPH